MASVLLFNPASDVVRVPTLFHPFFHLTCHPIIANYGSNGATTGTIVDRGLYGQALDRTKSEIAQGKEVFVTLQFGHSTLLPYRDDMLPKMLIQYRYFQMT